jgi:hypothetical protein
MVLANAESAERVASTGKDALRQFIEAGIALRGELVLPLHGGPPVTERATLALREQIHAALQRLINRGRQDGTIKTDVGPLDIVAIGALLAQPRSYGPGWDATCKRILSTYLNGLASSDAAEPETPTDRVTLR